MENIIYLVSFFFIILSLLGTMWVARNPGEDKHYTAETARNMTRLTWYYVLGTVASLLLLLIIIML